MCKMVDWFALRDIKLDQLLSGSNRTKMLVEKWHDWAGDLRCVGIYYLHNSLTHNPRHYSPFAEVSIETYWDYHEYEILKSR